MKRFEPGTAARDSSRCRLALIVLLTVAVTTFVSPIAAHEAIEHEEPELLNHWRTQVHLLFQWAHLVAFGVWLGGMMAARRLPGLSLDALLFGSWGLFLVSLGTGGYNMEFSAAIPDAPDIFSLPALEGRWPFGTAYVVLIGVKQALLAVAVVWTVVVTVRHLRWPPGRERGGLRAAFLGGSVAIGLALAGVTAMVLVLHEAIDLAPTPLHSLGGVVGPLGPDELRAARAAGDVAPAPYGGDPYRAGAGFRLFAIPQAAGDALARFGHLVGFATWLGANAASLLVPPSDQRRVVPQLWLALALQAVTGGYQFMSWTPFAVAPYPWRLSAMAHFRFGHTYTLLMALKLSLVALMILGTAGLTAVARRRHQRRAWWALAALNVAAGLVLAYVMAALLLVHEGVDHAL